MLHQIALHFTTHLGILHRTRRTRFTMPRSPKSPASLDSPTAVGESVYQETGDTAFAAFVTTKPVRTLADAVKACGVDLAVWAVDKWECGAWTVGIKIKRDGADEAVQTQQWRVRVYLKRRQPKPLQDATAAIFAKMARHAPNYSAAVKTPAKRRTSASETPEPFLAVLGLFDVHIGKFAWGRETGSDYDLRIAESVFRNAVDDLLHESASRTVSRWLLPIGNDFFHVDNSRNTTFAGTPQDVDGRYAKVIEAGELAVIWAVERMMSVAPVSVVWVPGNHDPTTSFHLARTVAAWFRKCDRVTVDHDPSPRKYVRFGSTLIGLTHGNEEKPTQLPALMATEKPREWAKTTCREWLLGHMHRSRSWQTQPVDTHEGTTIRALRSLSGTDSWHHRRGYVSGSSGRAAEVYWYGERRGYAGHAVVAARGMRDESQQGS